MKDGWKIKEKYALHEKCNSSHACKNSKVYFLQVEDSADHIDLCQDNRVDEDLVKEG